MDNSPNELESIQRLLERFERRLRIQRAVSGVVEGACLGLMIGGVAIAAMRTGWADSQFWWIWVLVAVLITVMGALLRALQPIDTVAAAQRIDQTHGLHDRLSTAVSLARQGDLSAKDDAFVRAQLRDALRHSQGVDPGHAAPWRRPPDTLLLVLVGLAVLTVGIIPLNDHEEPLPDPFEVQHGAVLDDATIALERARLEDFRRHLETLPDQRAEELADEIERLLDAAENREISDREFLERVEELLAREYASQVREQRELDALADALAEAAQQTAEEHEEALEENPEMARALEALEEGDFEAAAEALSDLAERIEEEEMSGEEASRLASLLERFAGHLDGHEDRLQELYENHRDTFESLAEQFDGEGFDGDEQLLEDARQAMEDAANRRDSYDDSDAKRQLERLSRELEESADQLRQQADQSGDAADEQERAEAEGEDGAPDDGQPQPPDLVDEERAEGQQAQQDGQPDRDEPDYRNEIGRQLEDASDQLEQMEQQRQRQERRRQAREQLEDLRESMSRGDREDSERRGEQMQDFMDRASGDQQGGGQPDEDGQELPTGTGDDQADGHDPGDADPDSVEFGESAGEGGPSEGVDHEEEDLEFGHTEEHLQGVDSEEGLSRSEIIEAASERGFATTEYQDVYAEYEDIAEEVMSREQVPDGYRYYVERYFQLIRPQQ